MISGMRGLLKSICPPIFVDFFQIFNLIYLNFLLNKTLFPNSKLKNSCRGRSCFVLGNAPSLNNYDLSLLSSFDVFTISNGYKLRNAYPGLKIKCHFLPKLCFSDEPGGQTPETAAQWLADMEHKLGDTLVFLEVGDRNLVENNDLFSNHQVHYFKGCVGAVRSDHIDLTKCIIPIFTGPHLAISAAIYMGYQNIYLLGIDHDWFATLTYDYFFDRSGMFFQDDSVDSDGAVKSSRLDSLKEAIPVFSNYIRLDQISKSYGVSIFNCSEASMLDMFPNANFREVVGENEGS